MAVIDLSCPLLLALLLCFFIVIKKLKKWKIKNSNPNHPPGPWRLPIIGNIHQLLGSLPHHSLRDLAIKYGPLMYLQLGEISTIVLSSPEMAKEIMKTHDIIFSYRPNFLASRIMSYGCRNIIFSPYGGYWRQLRKICMMELLSSRRVQSFKSIRKEEVSNFISYISLNAGMPINLSQKISELTYGITSRAALGEKCKDQELFISIIAELIRVAAGFSVADLFPSLEGICGLKAKIEKLFKQTDRILKNIINEHKSRTEMSDRETEDLVDVLLKLQENGEIEFPLSDDDIKAVILDIFSAGTETSSTAVDWAMSEMVKNPRVLKKAQTEVRQVFNGKGNVDETSIDELHYLKAVIKETLRLHPPLALVPRECSENCEINGYKILEKTRIIVNTWAIGRDPNYWTEAERFYPERFLDTSIDYKGIDFEYIPFGAGRRICPGIFFGLANTELPLAQLLYHFNWEMSSEMKPEELDMTEALGVTVKRRDDLILIPIPHSLLVQRQ